MKSYLSLLFLFVLITSCSEFTFELPVTTTSGLAFINARDMAVQKDTTYADTTGVNELTHDVYMDCPTEYPSLIEQ